MATGDELATVRVNASVCDAETVRLRATDSKSGEDEPMEPCAPREVLVGTAWIIAWALTVFIVANVIGSI